MGDKKLDSFTREKIRIHNKKINRKIKNDSFRMLVISTISDLAKRGKNADDIENEIKKYPHKINREEIELIVAGRQIENDSNYSPNTFYHTNPLNSKNITCKKNRITKNTSLSSEHSIEHY